MKTKQVVCVFQAFGRFGSSGCMILPVKYDQTILFIQLHVKQSIEDMYVTNTTHSIVVVR